MTVLRVVRREDYSPPPYLVPFARLEFDLGQAATTLRTTLTLQRNAAASGNGVLRLDGDRLELVEVAIDGVRLSAERFSVTADRLEIVDPPDSFKLTTTTRLYPERNTDLVGLYVTAGALCTHCEPHGFQRLTFFPDRPDVLSRYSVRLVADCDSFPVLLSNGNVAAAGRGEGNRHWVEWLDPFPKPSYLFAVVAGKFGRRSLDHIDVGGGRTSLSVYAAEADLPRLNFALRALEIAMTWDEKVYGRACDLNVFNLVAVSDHNFGAMENKGLNIYSRGNIVTSDGRFTTDDDYALLSLNIAHEYFHNWSGNRVTCRDWFQLALKEGLTTYRTEQYDEEMFGRAGSRIANVRNVRSKLFAEESAATVHPVVPETYVEVSNLYNSIVYIKGATIVRMLHLLVGDPAYRAGCDIFFEQHDGHAVGVEELVRAMEDASGRNLEQFRRWYYQPGTPTVRVESAYDPATGKCRVTVSQELPSLAGYPDPVPLHIPLQIGVLSTIGTVQTPSNLDSIGFAVGNSGSFVVELREWSQMFELEGISTQPLLSLMQDHSVPAKLIHTFSEDDLLRLARFDHDPVNRWDAIQRVFSLLLLGSADVAESDLDDLLALVAELLDDASVDPVLVAEMLTLPTEKELAEYTAPVNVDSLCSRRRALKFEMARALEDRWLACYQRMEDCSVYRFDPLLAARRRLKNVCLDYLVCAGRRDLALQQALRGANMTDAVAAAAALNQVPGVEREMVFAHLLDAWRPEPLAVDKWFQLQALIEQSDAAAHVQALQAHPEFDITRVGRVRALYAWFFILNFSGFHCANGEGYRFFAETVLRVDALNSTAAAWLLRKSDLMRWRRFASPWGGLMRDALVQLHSAPGLSNSTMERVEDALNSKDDNATQLA